MTHELKTYPNYFDAVVRGEKTFEVRRDDRGFQKGDILRLVRHDGVLYRRSEEYGYEYFAEITYVLTGGQFGIEPGYVVMGLKSLEKGGKGWPRPEAGQCGSSARVAAASPSLPALPTMREGGGRFASKSCKARHQERETGQYRQYQQLRKMAAQGLCFPDLSNEGEYGVGDFPRE